mmetsp:Transcript_14178/g.42043  ORF Transcript_14178/g.42043 Transcript_14178/m.42043 type:complete len:222 (+) Transcript_14178:145-810(+)
MASSMYTPIRAGDFDTVTPASSRAAIFSCAPPFPPEMIAPACPIRRPGGAVSPAINDTTGFAFGPELFALRKSAASSSAEPPISPIMIMPSVSGSLRKTSRQSMKSVPLNGSPPMPMQRDWPRPTSDVWPTASYVRVPDRDTTPILPFWWMCPGMIPILHASGAMMPGQFGPISRVLSCDNSAAFTLTMSCCGMPSVMHTTSGISASMASMMAAAANGGGT